MYSDEEMEEYDYSDPVVNHARLIGAVEFLKSGQRVTEDWVEEHKHHILKYGEVFPLFQLHKQMVQRDFQQLVKETQTLLDSLVSSIRSNGRFEPKHYLMVCEKILKLHGMMLEMDELEKALDNMNM